MEHYCHKCGKREILNYAFMCVFCMEAWLTAYRLAHANDRGLQ